MDLAFLEDLEEVVDFDFLLEVGGIFMKGIEGRRRIRISTAVKGGKSSPKSADTTGFILDSPGRAAQLGPSKASPIQPSSLHHRKHLDGL